MLAINQAEHFEPHTVGERTQTSDAKMRAMVALAKLADLFHMPFCIKTDGLGIAQVTHTHTHTHTPVPAYMSKCMSTSLVRDKPR